MDKLYAPWRDRYVQMQIKGGLKGACIFCELFTDQETDKQKLVLFKDKDLAVMLNLYPYNGGHLMVVPAKHAPELYEIPNHILEKLMRASALSMKIIEEALKCEGINFGANIGRAAGAGIPQHLHLHIVPRFDGDTGFFTTIGEGKQVSVDLEKIYDKLQPYFTKDFLG